MAQVSESLRRSGSRQSDQGAIWDDIAFKMNERGESSGTQAMADIYAGAEGKLSDYGQAFRPIPRQVGAVFAINGQIAGIELFDAPAALAAYLPKLVKSYALDALDAQHEVPPVVEAETIRQFLKQLGAATQERYPASGAGEDVRLEGEVITGGALEHEGKLIHLAAYPHLTQRTGQLPGSMSRRWRDLRIGGVCIESAGFAGYAGGTASSRAGYVAASVTLDSKNEKHKKLNCLMAI